jgi:hypothetical protein
MALASSQHIGGVAESPMTYELYSWQDAHGDGWKYRLLYNTSRQKTVEEVFDDRAVLRGIDQLKKKLSVLPMGSTIVWFDRLTLNTIRLKGSEGLKYPPQEIVDDLTHYAEKRGIKISGPDHVYP